MQILVLKGLATKSNVTQVYCVTLLFVAFLKGGFSILQNLLENNKITFHYASKTKLEIINHLLNLLNQHDAGTALHSYKVADIAANFAIRLNLPVSTIDDITSAALLHDIGKIKIPPHILNKPEKLTRNEFKIIKKHSQYGFEILKNIKQLDSLAEAVLCHHEKFNGKGYPFGKIGQEIPFISQILSIVDVYEAITSDRAYRKAMTRKEAIQVLHDGRGTHFNSELVNFFLLGGE
jgi:putative nucleotidyltransferase with HDIG domain